MDLPDEKGGQRSPKLIRTFNKPMFTRSNQAAEAETGNLGL
jgi:hypothetical protein